MRTTFTKITGALLAAALALILVSTFSPVLAQVGRAVKNGFTVCSGVNCDNILEIGGTLHFEGATQDAYEVIISVTDPTADRTFTFPDSAGGAFMISSLTTNGIDAANSVWGVSNALVFEGATADAFEITLSPADAAADSTATIPNYSGSIVMAGLIAAGATETVAAVTHAGACMALDTGGGSVVTLPAATGSGNRYCFVVTVIGAHQINVVGNDEFVGGIQQGNDTDNTQVNWPAADASDNDRISLNGTTQGGFVGCKYEIVDVLTDNWHVSGSCDASGTEVTPFVIGTVA